MCNISNNVVIWIYMGQANPAEEQNIIISQIPFLF